MLKIIATLTISLFPYFAFAANTEEKIANAVSEYNFGNQQRGIALFNEVLEEEPNNLEALWHLTYEQLSNYAGTSFEDQVMALNYYTGDANRLIEFAKQQGDVAMAHYIASRLAGMYKAYARAGAEIDVAIKHAPKSVRYLRSKMITYLFRAKWEKDEQYLAQAKDAFDQARALLETQDSIYTNVSELNFSYARWYPNFATDAKNVIIQHYLNSIEAGEQTSKLDAYAWNNMSSRYRELGMCDKAKEAAENALSYFSFGNANRNLFYAEACLQLEHDQSLNKLDLSSIYKVRK